MKPRTFREEIQSIVAAALAEGVDPRQWVKDYCNEKDSYPIPAEIEWLVGRAKSDIIRARQRLIKEEKDE